MKIRYIIGLVALVAGFIWYYRVHPLVSKVRIGDAVFSVKVALTEQQKHKGLGGLPSLAPDEGMLFPYDHKEQYEFWMLEMKFPLDIVWIDGKTVADISENVPAPATGVPPAIVKPRVAVDRVFEIRAGTVRRLGIAVGDTVEYIDR